MTPTDSARLKLDRANEHLDALDAEIRTYLDGGAHLTSARLDEDGWHVISVRVVKDFPGRVGLLAGDAVHNLRAALDHVVYGVSTGRNKRRSYFPICTKEADYIAPRGSPPCERPSMRDEGLGGVPSNLLAIFDAAQPYHAGDEAEGHVLACIGRLDNADKHRAVQPALTVVHDPNAVHIEAGPQHDTEITGEWIWLAKGQALRLGEETDVFRWRTDTPLVGDVKVNLQPRFNVVFGERAAMRDLLFGAKVILSQVIEPVEAQIGNPRSRGLTAATSTEMGYFPA